MLNYINCLWCIFTEGKKSFDLYGSFFKGANLIYSSSDYFWKDLSCKSICPPQLEKWFKLGTFWCQNKRFHIVRVVVLVVLCSKKTLTAVRDASQRSQSPEFSKVIRFISKRNKWKLLCTYEHYMIEKLSRNFSALTDGKKWENRATKKVLRTRTHKSLNFCLLFTTIEEQKFAFSSSQTGSLEIRERKP